MSILNKNISLALLFIATTFQVQATTYYVSPNGSDAPPYSSWAAAANRIQTAVDAASDGDTVLVYDGTYQSGHTNTPGTTSLNRLVITKNITVRSFGGAANTIISGKNFPFRRGDVVVRCVYITNGRLEGFTLKDGYATTDADPTWYQSGGGVHVNGGGTVRNCIIKNNTASWNGGGAYGNGNFFDCSFSGNSTTNNGGGSYYGTFTDCTFTSNTAHSGGGCYSSTLTDCTLIENSAAFGGGSRDSDLDTCTIDGNIATSKGGGDYDGSLTNCTLSNNSAPFGGGTIEGSLVNCILTNNSALSGGGSNAARLDNCTLIGNTANLGGGSTYGILRNCVLSDNTATNNGGGANNGTLSDCTLSGNTASLGGGSYDGNLTDCILSDNTAEDGGGNYGGDLANCTIANNQATRNGGGCYESSLTQCTVMDNTAFMYGGGSCDSDLVRCVLTGNSAQFGGGCCDQYDSDTDEINNCLIVNNTANYGGGSHFARLEYCTVKGNVAEYDGGGCYKGSVLNSIIVDNEADRDGTNLFELASVIACCCPNLVSGQTGTTADPLFADALLHLRADSPCIDSAVIQGPGALIDLDGLPRPLDGDLVAGIHADMGAYEFASTTADYDNDGLSDSDEANIYGSNLNDTDTDNDGREDGAEVAMGFSPTYDESAAIAQGENNVTGDPATHGLYTADSIQDLSMGALMVQAEGDQLHLSLQMKQTTNLTSNVWNDAGEAQEWTINATNGKSFFRVIAE